jgi:hypothetical protein
MLGVRRQTQMMMAKASGVLRAGNFIRKKEDPTKHPQRIAAGLISSSLIRKPYLKLDPTTLNRHYWFLCLQNKRETTDLIPSLSGQFFC